MPYSLIEYRYSRIMSARYYVVGKIFHRCQAG